MVYRINQLKCKRCGICADSCGHDFIYRENDRYYIDEEQCTGCGVCANACPEGAIEEVFQ